MIFDEPCTVASRSDQEQAKLTAKDIRRAIRSLKPAKQSLEECRAQMAELGLAYEPFTGELRIIDPLKLPEFLKAEVLKAYAVRVSAFCSPAKDDNR